MENKGFTLIELLVVLAIIALLGTMAAVAVNSARERSRDFRRLNDISQIQASLEDHFNQKNTYPSGSGLPLGDAALSTCLSSEGFSANCIGDSVTFMTIVPALYDKGLKDLVQCGDPMRTAYCYYQITDGASYSIEVEFERNVPERGIVKGVNCATPSGISTGSCSQ